MSRRLLTALCCAGFAAPASAQSPEPPAYAITNATVVPVTGPRLTGGTVIIRRGRIEAVGAQLPVPADATRIDGTGLFVYPGIIDAGSRLGLTEIGSVPGGEDTQEIGDFNPHNEALTAVNPSSELIPVTRVNGLTTAITSARGGLIQGWAALIDLAGWTPDEMAVAPKAAMVMTYPSSGGGRGRGFRRGGAEGGADAASRQVRDLTQFLRDARDYNALSTHDRTDLAFAALGPALRGEVPVIFDVTSAAQIRGVLALADSFKLKPILRGATEAWMLADQLAQRSVPVIVGPMTQMPDGDDPYDALYAMPGVLAKAGVQIAFQSNDASDARNLPYNAALATAYGLDPDEALKALTINPARMFGVADRIGSIEAGKVANLQVTTGDPLDVRTQVKHVFIRGQLIAPTDRHTTLYERFRARPKP
ncbi:MAG: amidohydrolase family protein [Gemmatimonadales bacterium]